MKVSRSVLLVAVVVIAAMLAATLHLPDSTFDFPTVHVLGP